MKKNHLILLLTLTMGLSSFSQKKIWNETEKEKTERMAWWQEARFGMFIHWGLYAQAARHEWVKKREHISDTDYQKYFDVFNPDLFDPREWAKKAKAAGMKYAVLTTKHHEGFSMFKTDYSDYNSTNTPYGKDILKEWVEAFRAEGLGIGFYYSLIDWHHPDFTIDSRHSIKVDNKEEYDGLNKGRDMAVYRKYLKNQVRELLSNYGKVDLLWLDFSYPGEFGKGRDDWGSVELIKMVRKLQPKILVNDRLDLKEYAGGWDFTTPEQFKVEKWPEVDGKRVPWETCQTFSGSWGYYRDEHTWKDNKQLLTLLIESVSKGGNLLLNVGPTARGTFDYRADQALEGMGDWMRYNSRSIYGCTQAPEEFVVPANSLLTYNPKTNRLYVHLLDYPIQNFIMKGIRDKIKYAQFLHDASEIKMGKMYGAWGKEKMKEGDVNLVLPVNKPNVEISVIEIFLKD
ncbi:alpha-L-fucosidase [Maribacter polysaccharolyticus]|uniref:alpha-L-fucosidase n=1 Tax=Maribacter polysaccharolyticus TaxID=3020831 RepID=UPI00237F3886|nr:alpha-L-fucosidase [Maribacter polysaccharolyticus]MDE3741801.1 alpha-L-fucosidase [Maribacter polysaccharolyticus]